MAGLRKGVAVRKVTRAYTRKSKFRKKGYIKTTPTNKIVRYIMGDQKKKFEYRLDLKSRDKLQIRHNAIESVRIIVNKGLSKKLGPLSYLFQIRIYPHHVIRENKVLTGAGADRMQTGMQQAFGRPIGIAAQVKKNQVLFSVYVDKNKVDNARVILRKAYPKLPCKCSININKLE